MSENEGFGSLDDAANELTDSVGSAVSVVGVFSNELTRMRSTLAATGQDVATLEKGLSKGLRKAFDGVVFGSSSMSDALRTVATSLINTTYNAAMKPVTNHLGGLLSQGVGNLVGKLLPFADGAPFSQGRVMPFATGGVVSSATPFGMRGGMGLWAKQGRRRSCHWRVVLMASWVCAAAVEARRKR